MSSYLRVFVAYNYIAELSYQTSHAWTRRLYSHVGIKTSKASHAPRVAATQNADMAGVPEAQVGNLPLTLVTLLTYY